MDKQKEWDRVRGEVDAIADALGKGVDEGIKEAVIALRACGFTTDQSCEGHIGKDDHGLSFPWVQIYAPEPESWQESEQKKEEWIVENLKQQKKLMDLFEEFYQNRETPFESRLTFAAVGDFGGFRLQSFGAELTRLLSLAEKGAKLELYRKEMNEFAEFLKKKFFE